MSQHGRKRSASCREESQSSSTSAWEPASKRLRSLVHQMRSLSLGDLPWSRRKLVLDVRPPDPPPTPDATPVPERRLLGGPGPDPVPAAAAAAAAAAVAAAAAARVLQPARYDDDYDPDAASGPSLSPGGFGGGYGGSSDVTLHGAKRGEDEPAGSRAKKARNRMRLGQNGVVMTSCYIEQTLYT